MSFAERSTHKFTRIFHTLHGYSANSKHFEPKERSNEEGFANLRAVSFKMLISKLKEKLEHNLNIWTAG